MQFGSNTLAQWAALLSNSTSRKSPPPRPPPPLTWADRVARGLTPVRHTSQIPLPISPPPSIHPLSPPRLPSALPLPTETSISPPTTLLPPTVLPHHSPSIPLPTFLYNPLPTKDPSPIPSSIAFPKSTSPHPNTSLPSLPSTAPKPPSPPLTTAPPSPPRNPPSPTRPPRSPPRNKPRSPNTHRPAAPKVPLPTPPQPVKTTPNGYAQAARANVSHRTPTPVQPAPRRSSHAPSSSPSKHTRAVTSSAHHHAALSTVRRSASACVDGRERTSSSDTVSASSLADPSSPSFMAASTRRRRRPPRMRAGDVVGMSIPPRALRGLVNCGNSCFTNAVLQALVAVDSFRGLMLRCDELGIGESEGLIRKFVRLVKEMTVGGRGENGHGEVNGGGKYRYGVEEEDEDGDMNGWSHPVNGGKGGHHGGKVDKVESGKRKENGFTAEEPLVADWFHDVFPGSGVDLGGGGSGGGSQEDAEEFLTYVLNQLHEELVELEKQAEGLADDTSSGSSVTDVMGTNGSVKESSGGKGAGASGRKGNGVLNGWLEAAENGVWEEMTRKGKTVEVRGGSFPQSGITDIFQGVLRSEVKRMRTKPSVTKEPFYLLGLDIESGMIRDVEDAVRAYFEPEQLEGVVVGDEVVEARKQVAMEKAPEILILRLKRFSHNSITGALTKVQRMMAFPQVLELPSQVGYGAAGKKYELSGVVTHIGKDLASGHYTCDLRWAADSWVHCDDSKVVRTSLAKVARKPAYLLFYSLRAGKSVGSGAMGQ